MPAPLVVAHRGASQDVPEHTLAAYELALADGADGLEADVRLTADGQLVCVHDRRLDRTTDGVGVVSTMTLAQLEEMDFGASREDVLDEVPELEDGDGAHRVLTLERLLELSLSYARPTRLLVETKHPTRFAGYVEQRVAEVLADHGLDQVLATGGSASVEVTLMSFSEVALRRMRRLTPNLPLVYLMERVPLIYRSGQLPRGVSVAGPRVDVLRSHPSYVERVQDRGGRLYVWTVDEPEDVELVTALGVDAIITNRPRQVRAQVDVGA
jgi:glycerophosphoryl diester phosphodiesterase